MNATSLGTIEDALTRFGVSKWFAFCECSQHAGKTVYISPSNLAKVSFLLQADPFTPQGAKAINHDILNRLASI